MQFSQNQIVGLFRSRHPKYTFKQEALFQEALSELSMKGEVHLDHKKGLCYLDGKEYRLTIPLRYFRVIKDISKEKRYEYTFTGKKKEARAWVEEFGDDALINFTDKGREIPKDYLDIAYYRTMCQSRFTLCPVGDFKWTYRFFEAIMCKSIPIVERQGIDPSMDGFVYFLQDERSNHCYSTEVCDDNYRLLVARHSMLKNVLDIPLEI